MTQASIQTGCKLGLDLQRVVNFYTYAELATMGKGKNLSIGIDLGGTKIASGLVDHRGKLLKADRRPSKSPDDAKLAPKERIRFCVESMADSALSIVESRPGKTLKQKSAGICGVGLAAAGPLNVEKGQITHPANFEGWGVVPIVKLLTKALEKRGLRLKVHFQNDAVAAALGEGWIGRAKNCTTYAMITLGTGVGSGVILNGRPAQSRGMGSEWGHLLIDVSEMAENPDDFFLATVEGMASGTGMMRQAQQKGFICRSPADLADAAREGNPIAIEIFTKAAQALASIFYNLSIGFNLDTFVITGGLLPIKDFYVPQAITLYKRLIKSTAPEFLAPVVISKVGNDAGIIGAARLPFLD